MIVSWFQHTYLKQSLKLDICICNEDGKLCVKMKGIEYQSLEFKEVNYTSNYLNVHDHDNTLFTFHGTIKQTSQDMFYLEFKTDGRTCIYSFSYDIKFSQYITKGKEITFFAFPKNWRVVGIVEEQWEFEH